MDINFLVQIPVANPVKFTLDGVLDNQRAAYDKRRYFKSVHATTEQRRWLQPAESTDPLRVQYYSNYPLQRLQVVNCDDEVFQTYTPSLGVQYKGKKYRSDAKFYSIDDKLFIYFQSGTEYTDEDFLVPGDTVNLLGRLPNVRAVAGDIIRYKVGLDFEVTTVASIQWSPELQAQGYLTNADYTLLSPVDGLFEITYDEKEANLYYQAVNLLPLIEGEYYLKLSFGVSSFTRHFYTEALDVKISHPKSQAIEYRHEGTFEEEDIWSYLYLSDWTNVIRMPADFFEVEVAGEVDLDTNDNGVPRMLRARPYRQLAFKAYNIPGWLVDKLSVIFSHDTKRINEDYWENEALGEYSIIARTDLGQFEIKLRQVNDRTNFITEFTESVTALFTPDSFSDLDFDGEVVVSTFTSNTAGVFAFLSLPDWITTDHPTFVNGDVIEFTIDSNATSFDRSITLSAISESFDGLIAQISFEQVYDDSIPEFIDVDDYSVELFGAGDNQLLNVSSSGDYDITYSGDHDFTAAKESGFTQVRISEPTDNNTSEDRTGVVRLTLQSNPSIFVEVNVIQPVSFKIVGFIPNSLSVARLSSNQIIQVSVVGSASWQASSPNPWLSFPTGIQVGTNASFNVYIGDNPLYNPPRVGSITVVNVANPADSKTLTIFQSDT